MIAYSAAVNSDAGTLRTLLPIGMGSVEECNEWGAIYVDKTEFAFKLLVSGGKSFMFLRPRRFGKTFFLNTLASILEGKKEVFENTFIGDPKNGYSWKEHTVVRLTFKRLNPVRRLGNALVGIAQAHGVYEALAHIDSTDVEYFEELLYKLSPKDRLRKPTGKQPVALLIDEYDLPFRNADERIRKYFRDIFATLKSLADEGHVRLAFFTGCNRVNLLPSDSQKQHSGLYTTLGIVDISLDPVYHSICGFTEAEIEKYFHVHVKEIADRHKVDQGKVMNEMKRWYDGYRFTPDPTSIYNPVSLLFYLRDKHLLKPKNYWIHTQNHPHTILEALIAVRMKSKKAILDLRNRFDDGQLFQPAESTPDLLDSAESEDKQAINSGKISLESLLFQNGYLTITDHDATQDQYKLNFPNMEIKQAFTHAIQLALEEDDDYEDLHETAKKSLEDLDIDLLAETLNSFIQNHRLLSLVETTTTENEGLLKALLQNLLSLNPLSREPTDEWKLERERWTSYQSTEKGGKMDFFVETSSNLILIECKYGATDKEMEKAWSEQAGGSGGYVLPSFYSASKKIRVRLLLNFHKEGIYKWRGDKHDAQGKFLGKLVQKLEKEQKSMSLSSKKFTCGKCKQTFSRRDNLVRHLQTVHKITDPVEIKKYV